MKDALKRAGLFALLIAGLLGLADAPSYAVLKGGEGQLPNAANAVLPDAHDNIGLKLVSVKDCGTKGDDTGDDSVAMNTCAQRARDALAANSYPVALVIPGGIYRTTGTWNLTCFADKTAGADGCPNNTNRLGPLTIISLGATIDCHVSSGACIDGIGSSHVHVPLGLRLIGDCTDIPAIGLQFGRATLTAGATAWSLDGISTDGCFSTTALYNGGSEESVLRDSLVRNLHASGIPYTYVFDPANHFNVSSTLITRNVPQDSAIPSLSQDSIVDTSFVTTLAASPVTPLWIAGTQQLELRNVYASSGSGNCVTIYNDSSGTAQALPSAFYADIHCEPASFSAGADLTADFLFVSKTAASTATLQNFTYRNGSEDNKGSIFKLGTNTTAVRLTSGRIDVAQTLGGTSGAVFDTPSAYSLSSQQRNYINGQSGWTPTVGGTSCTGVGSTGTCTLQAGSDPESGVILLTAGGTGIAASGVVDLTTGFNRGLTWSTCVVAPIDVTGVWDTAATLKIGNTTLARNNIPWKNNATALASGSIYGIHYQCRGA